MALSNEEVTASKKPAQQMTCMEVWGGSQLTTRAWKWAVWTPGFTANRSATRSAAEMFTTRRVVLPDALRACCWRMFRATETPSPQQRRICEL